MTPARFFRGVTPRLVGVTALIVILCVGFAGTLATHRHYLRALTEAEQDLRVLCDGIAPAGALPAIARALPQPPHLRRRAMDGVFARLRGFQPDLTHLSVVRAIDGRELYRTGTDLPRLTAAVRASITPGHPATEPMLATPAGLAFTRLVAGPGGTIVRAGIDLPSFPAFLLEQGRADAAWILLSLALASVVSTVLVGMLTRSLRSVTSYAEAIERGEAVHPIEVSSRDEAGAIADAFNAVLHRLRRSYVSTLGALAALLETRDRHTESHSQRGLKYAMELGKAAGLTPQELGDLEYGSLLHDIGKVGIADHILRKTGPLTEEEWEIMRQHPTIGYNVLKNLDFLQNSLPVVLHHQERWDGKGYPNGLKGEEIPLLARVFTIADSFDAMTSDRTYRRAMRPALAIQEMKRNGGNQFDPRLVDLFVGLWESGKLGQDAPAETAAA